MLASGVQLLSFPKLRSEQPVNLLEAVLGFALKGNAVTHAFPLSSPGFNTHRAVWAGCGC